MCKKLKIVSTAGNPYEWRLAVTSKKMSALPLGFVARVETERILISSLPLTLTLIFVPLVAIERIERLHSLEMFPV